MNVTPLLSAAANAPAGSGGWLNAHGFALAVWVILIVNLLAGVMLLVRSWLAHDPNRVLSKLPALAKGFLVNELLAIGGVIMLLPFYWMVVTAFKDSRTSAESPPIWTPTRFEYRAVPPGQTNAVKIVELEVAKKKGDLIKVVPEDKYVFKRAESGGFSTTHETADPAAIFSVDPDTVEEKKVINLDLKNFRRAWYKPEDSSRGQVNFFTYFWVSIVSSGIATGGTLITAALAAFAFARLEFYGKNFLFYLVLGTMMVPGQVLLIPNFLILSKLGWLDTYAALTVPWLTSVFTIFLMRQFFMTIPTDLWDAARVDGISRFRYLWQVVFPLSKPVFITAGIFDFLNNWNSLLWPLIVTSTPARRTLMVGLQNLNEEAVAEFHILMAASCFAILPVVVIFFFLQRFFIEGIARTGLK
ncbi:MAG TPA: carbohydrate ABC transporter permease [Candidatus Sumerlaeota bacterium]|nr:carbohydrate ABC transporter permease [Candidatus Sumerlaeota bacterium]